jgi:uncharacterized membrane protein
MKSRQSLSQASAAPRDHATQAIIGAAVGATLMYVFDPERGTRRRKRLRDRAVHRAHATADFAGTASRDAGNRVTGLAAALASRFRTDSPDDVVIAERVRAELGRAVSHPGAIEVGAADGLVTLCGDVLDREHDDAIEAAARVKGVEAVEDLLSVHEAAGDVPALQGQGRSREARPELAQENWSPAVRFFTGAGGAALAWYGLRERGLTGALYSAAGAALLLRAATNAPLGRVVGIRGGRQALHIQKTINVNAPVEDVYAFFTEWERFPEWMTHVRSVRASGIPGAVGEKTHWEVDGPAGVPVSWDAETTEVVPRQRVSWRSVEGAAIRQSGTMRFEPNDDGSTRVNIQMSYNPPAGMAGHAVAKILGRDPKKQMDADLARLKTTIETGQPPHDAAASA